MAYNTKAIKTDANGKPIPQLYNPVTDEYEVLQGVGGAARQVLYGPDGNPISTTEGKLAVRAEEIETLLTALKGKDFATETKLEAVRVLLNSLAGEDFATQTTLAQILEKMIASPATEAKQAEMLAALGKQSTAEKQEALANLVGALDAEVVSDPAAAGAVIALLKGVLERLQAVEGKIDGITDGTTPAKTEAQLTGSKIRLVRNLQTLNDPIEPGQSENITTFATAGHIATLNILSFVAANPDDATTGTHGLRASTGMGLSVERFLEFSNVYNTNVLFNTYGGYEGTASEELISASRQAINAGAIKFNDKIPLMIVYRNDTDVVQTKTRYLLIAVTEEAYI